MARWATYIFPLVTMALLLALAAPGASAQTCYDSVQDIPASCEGGSITQDTWDGCRTIVCDSGSDHMQILACDKDNNFEMYKQEQTGTSVQNICIGETCITNGQYDGYEASSSFPICTEDSTDQPSDDYDYGQDSWLSVNSGSELNGQPISPSDQTIEVAPGESITGTVQLHHTSNWPDGIGMAYGYTPTWSTHSTSYTALSPMLSSSSGERSVSISEQAPTTEGTYYLVFAFRAEEDAADVMSMTNWAANPEQWGDGNDVAGWSSTMIQEAMNAGHTTGPVMFESGYESREVPSEAIRIHVTSTQDDTNDTTSTACYDSVQNIPASCEGGSITQDTWNGCRTIVCDSGSDHMQILACDKDNNFEMYKQEQTGTGVQQVCLADTCITNGEYDGYEASPQYPICTQGDSGGNGDNADYDYGEDSALAINAGTQGASSSLNLQSIGPNDQTIEVSPGERITGTVHLDYTSNWPNGVGMAFGHTTTWGAHSASYESLEPMSATSSGERAVNIEVLAPEEEGTYYLIFAFRAEEDAADVMSMTNWDANPERWNDGNDIAAWSDQQVQQAMDGGQALGRILYNSGYEERIIPAEAVRVIVQSEGGTNENQTDDPGAISKLRIESGTVNGQSVTTGSTITVAPGEQLTGSMTLRASNAWMSNTELIGTPSWGDHQRSYTSLGEVTQGSTSFPSVSVDSMGITAPSSEGTYKVIFAYRGEVDGGDVASLTNWDANPERWNDGNDVASWSPSQTSASISDERAPADVWFDSGYQALMIPSTVFYVQVEGGGGGQTCVETVHNLPVECMNGGISSDTSSGTCRTVTCTDGDQAKACDKNGHYEVYNQAGNGDICFGDTCLNGWGYKQGEFPYCFDSGTTLGADNTTDQSDSIQLNVYEEPGVPFGASVSQKRDAPTTELSGSVNFDDYSIDHEVIKAQMQYNFTEPLSADHVITFTWSNTDTGNSGSPPHLVVPAGSADEYSVFGTVGKKTFGAGEIDRPGNYEAAFNIEGPDIQRTDNATFTFEGTMPECTWCEPEPMAEVPDASADITINPLFPADNNVVFECDAQGFEPTSYTFDLGDGSSETRPVHDIYHTYSEEGSYTVTCTATDGTNTASDSVTVDITTSMAPRPLDRTHLEAVVTTEVIEDRTVQLTCDPVGFGQTEVDHWQLFGDGENHGYDHPGAISTTSGGGSGSPVQFRYDTSLSIQNVFPSAGDYYALCSTLVEDPKYHPDYYDYTQDTYHNMECNGGCAAGVSSTTFTIPQYEVDYPVGDECTATTGTEYLCTGTNETCRFDELDSDGSTVGYWEGGSRTCEEGYWYPASAWE